MAWKLRKDKLQEDEAQEGATLSDTAIPDENPIALAPDTDATEVEAEERSPIILTGPNDAITPEEEPELVPLQFGTLALLPLETDAQEPPESPLVFDAPTSEEPEVFNPFVPFQPEETALSPTADNKAVFPGSMEREDFAPNLVSGDADEDVPHVAPFIVDIPPAAIEAPAAPATLIVRIGNLAANFTLIKDVSSIGRPDSVLQSYPDIEIELDDAVSRRHAEIRRQGQGYVIVDTDSTNGTWLNGERLAAHQEYPIGHGDRIHLGDRTEILFE